MAIKIYPYRQGSRSANRLAQILHGRVLKREGSSYSPRYGDTIINWGDSQCPLRNSQARLLNHPDQISRASNKTVAFRAMREAGVSIPEFATSAENVTWRGSSDTVVRHKLTGHSGEGIEIVEGNEKELPSAPLYVQYIKKQDEYRVHVIGDTVVLVQRKARRLDVPEEDVNWKVRNHDNGFIFQRNGVTDKLPSVVTDEARKALTALGLDFGAVDVIWNAKEKKAYVLEINTAPGLEGSTLNDYAEGFKRLLQCASN